MAASGDPQVVAAPVFVIGSIALGIQLTQAIDPVGLGSPIAVLLGTTGLFLLVSTWWAASAGQSFVACFAGTFGGFWIGYSVLVLGVLHGWFLIPPGAIANTVVMFSVTFAIFFVFLTLASLRLPIIYPLIFGLVVLALCLVAAAYSMTPISTNVLKVAGYVIFAFAALGMSLSWTVMNLSLGGPAFPPLGPTVIKPPSS
jgi:succinate-acetate transporter protein